MVSACGLSVVAAPGLSHAKRQEVRGIWVWEINRKVQCKCGGKKKERKRKGKERKRKRKLKEGERKGIIFYDEY